MPAGEPISAAEAARRQQLFEAGVQLGVLRHAFEDNETLSWRFDGGGFEVKCYRRADGQHTFWSNARPADLEALLRRDWRALPALVPRPRIEPLPPGERRGHEPAAAGATRRQPRVSDLSKDQREVFEQIVHWSERAGGSLLTLGGYAGTGKTTLVALLAEVLGRTRRLAFCSYTGKAASVLRQKLRDAGVADAERCSTIHGLIYRPEVDPETGEILGWNRVPALDADLVIVDEASMVSAEIWSDLQSYGCQVLAVGDHGQLPPVDTSSSVNLVQHPDLRLEQIHRQARGHPILAFAEHVRAGGAAADFAYGEDPRLLLAASAADVAEILDHWAEAGADLLDHVVLCRTNRVRQALNTHVRTLRNGVAAPAPVPGDAVICLRNVAPQRGPALFNGMRGILEQSEPAGAHHFAATVLFPHDGFRLRAFLNAGQFGRRETFGSFEDLWAETGQPVRAWPEAGLLFDYGFALTVHKSQGSQFRRVMVVEEPPFAHAAADEHRRWLYTAATRATEELVVVPERVVRELRDGGG